MKRILSFLLCFAGAWHLQAANSMLQNPVTGSLSNVIFLKLCMAGNGKDVVLLATDNKAIYAIDIADNDAGEAVKNAVTSVPDFVAAKLTPVAGQTVVVNDMVVNPVSKAVYITASNGTMSAGYIFKVKNNGAAITMIDLSNITYSKIAWSGAANIMDMAWGNGTMYASSGMGLASLDGELGWMKPPFAHNSTMAKRATTMFKSNWGNKYLTDAPLETLAYGEIGGKKHLMGVTTCAPGFSADVDGLQGSGLLQVTEDFNVNSGMSYKVIFQKHDGGNWLFDLHEGMSGRTLYRIGEKYINGSQVAANKYNASAVELRDINMNRTAGLTDADLKQFSGTYQAISFWDDYRLLVLEAGNGALKMLQTANTAPPLQVDDVLTGTLAGKLTIYPNPSTDKVTVNLPAGMQKGRLAIYDATGKLAWQRDVEQPSYTFDSRQVGRGSYIMSVTDTKGHTTSAKFTVQ